MLSIPLSRLETLLRYKYISQGYGMYKDLQPLVLSTANHHFQGSHFASQHLSKEV